MATLNVGSGQQYATIAAAVAASRDGDVIAVQAGTYTNDFATISTDITIQAVGGVAKLVATVAPPNGKAIFVTRSDVTIQGLEFTGTKVPDGNGAGIRFEGGNLTILDSHFHHNENGILSGAYPDGTITIRNSEFGHNGAGDGRTHNLYIGAIGRLTIEDSYLHDAVVGHEVKSRAYETIIRNSRIQNEDGNGSYEVDLPNGGRAVLTGNVIQQGPASQNPAIVHFGGEGTPYAGSSLEISGNTVINQLASPSQRLLLNQTTYTATITDNAVFGLSSAQIASGPATVSGTTYLATAPALDTSPPGSDTTPAPGNGGDDVVRLDAPMSGGTVDLGDGADRLVLSSAGPNTLTASNVEVIIGGKAADAVTLGTAGVRVDLRDGADRLVLSSAGPNNIAVLNVETIQGGAADDLVRLLTAANGASVELGGGTDRVRLFADGANTLTVHDVELVFGGKLGDRVTVATSGPAMLDGAAGDDTLIGGGGADRIFGGAGADEMTGGAERDRFFFRAPAESSAAAPDHITDFVAGLDDLVFVGLLQGSFAWRGSGAFTASGNSEARFVAATSVVQVDADGNGMAEMAVDLTGGSLSGLSAKDFIWS
ncbi:right-handed parallel beta-helix repeat-containing protein [Falsiroseomonas sp.]|uniref:calcium-binding protein n=1 Tax=Falsiroseomonas sp. TaxID=2870721 RepID=UPI00356A2EF8